MNLSNYPRLSELGALTQQLEKEHCYYDIIIEHEGTVRMEESSKSKLDYQYRFCFKQCLLKSKSEEGVSLKNLKYLNQLYKDLLYCWENQKTGVIDADYITGILNLQHRQEANKKWEMENLNTIIKKKRRQVRGDYAFNRINGIKTVSLTSL